MVGNTLYKLTLALKTMPEALYIFMAFALSKIIILISLWIAYLQHPGVIGEGWRQLFCHWDCSWYVNVAEGGYDSIARHWETGAGANWAFFPLLPIVIRLGHMIIGADYVIIAIVTSQCLFFVSLLLFHTYAKGLSLPSPSFFPRIATIFLAVWPYSAYFQAPMSESLFLPLSVMMFLFARNERWVSAGVSGALLSATRIVGLAAVPVIALFVLQRRSVKSFIRFEKGTERALLGMGLGGVGAGLFALYLHYHIGDALAFLHIQTAWNRSFKWPWMLILDELNPNFAVSSPYVLHVYYTVIALSALYLLVVLIRYKLWAEALFSFIAVLMVLMSGSLVSTPRLLGGMFPFVIAVSIFANTVARGFLVFIFALIADVSVWVALFLEGNIGAWGEYAM